VPTQPFRRDEVVAGSILQRFRELVAPSARTDFEAGVSALGSGDFPAAEARFKSAQRATSALGDATAPLTYLAATYAASGHDAEAANVWQTALIDGDGYPEIYEWLADALVRTRNYERARGVLTEAAAKWPADERFSARLRTLPPEPPAGR
jgi:tetratricopeptide (TPR) repeat protein